MKLEKLLENFTLEGSVERECIGDNQFTALQEPPEEFLKVAKAILSGHFVVQNSSNESERVEVYPTCVEIYYHEEQANGVKDPIVYHRNRKKKSGEDNPQVFTPKGVLHNHVSGIDITFEKEANADNKIITDIVRASALIREFSVKIWKTEKGEIAEKVIEKENRSTYIYEYLFGQFSIFDGFTISWKDDEECDLKEPSPRKNVFEYELPHKDKDEYDYHKTTRSCLRRWQFRGNDK